MDRILFVLAVLVLGGCAPDTPGSRGGGAIETEAFMQAMVALRLDAADRPGSVLQPAQAERILAERGLRPDDLRRFVEVHGQNVPFMNNVWAEVERRIRETREAERDGGT